ncbi:unnamed protein product, partial [Vitrella brassicaformis CCMP3155]
MAHTELMRQISVGFSNLPTGEGLKNAVNLIGQRLTTPYAPPRSLMQLVVIVVLLLVAVLLIVGTLVTTTPLGVPKTRSGPDDIAAQDMLTKIQNMASAGQYDPTLCPLTLKDLTVGGSQVAGPLYSGVNYFPDALFEWQLDYPNDPDPMEFAIRTNPASIINNVCVDLYLRKLQNEYPQSISV